MSRTRKRQPTGPKAVSHACRNHGECPDCLRARTKARRRDAERVADEMNELHQMRATSIEYRYLLPWLWKMLRRWR